MNGPKPPQPNYESRLLSEDHLQRELDHDRRAERWLWGRAAIALLVVAVIIVVRQVFFP